MATFPALSGQTLTRWVRDRLCVSLCAPVLFLLYSVEGLRSTACVLGEVFTGTSCGRSSTLHTFFVPGCSSEEPLTRDCQGLSVLQLLRREVCFCLCLLVPRARCFDTGSELPVHPSAGIIGRDVVRRCSTTCQIGTPGSG